MFFPRLHTTTEYQLNFLLNYENLKRKKIYSDVINPVCTHFAVNLLNRAKHCQLVQSSRCAGPCNNRTSSKYVPLL